MRSIGFYMEEKDWDFVVKVKGREKWPDFIFRMAKEDAKRKAKKKKK